MQFVSYLSNRVEHWTLLQHTKSYILWPCTLNVTSYDHVLSMSTCSKTGNCSLMNKRPTKRLSFAFFYYKKLYKNLVMCVFYSSFFNCRFDITDPDLWFYSTHFNLYKFSTTTLNFAMQTLHWNSVTGVHAYPPISLEEYIVQWKSTVLT